VLAEASHAPRERTELRAVGRQTPEVDLHVNVVALRATERHDLIAEVLDVVGGQRAGNVQ
jgi:hypothetical protein